MNRMLTQVESILKAEIIPNKNRFGVKRIIVGTIGEAMRGLLQFGDYPAILISEGKQTNVKSVFANHLSKEFEVIFYLFYKNSIPNMSRKDEGQHNERPSFNELINELQYIYSKNKKLNGEVTQWSNQFDIEPMETIDGFQVLKMTTNWKDDLIPWPGVKNDQRNLRVDPDERLNPQLHIL